MKKAKKPDMPAKNLERAGWAAQAVELFGKITGCRPATEGWKTAIVDLLCDLRHLCDREGLDWYGLLENAKDHYCAETRCAECSRELKAGDNADDVDCVCKKCEAKLVQKQ